MKKDEAKKLIGKTFENSYSETAFREFIVELFNGKIEHLDSTISGQIKESFREHIVSYKRLGKYKTPDNKKIDIISVKLKKDYALERARTMQRNFVADYLKTRGEKDAALVAFYSENRSDWRFSFIKMDYQLELKESGAPKIKVEWTPSKRYSFLVGKDEPSHTAQQQLLPTLLKEDVNPTLEDIENAFSIETVTKEFFNEYKELFLKLKEELDNLFIKDKVIHEDFESKSIDTAQFAKKLMGQIVFLYFLQKKGWLGVAKDETWGTGPKNFLKHLFDKKIIDYDNFHNDVLEYLFYEALAEKQDNVYYEKFKCKIPHLNGGLFEPLDSYNWRKTDIVIKNEIFEKIFSTFNLYNFTVREDEPLEKEVAVDPEMLGKVFENLLEVHDRKSKGAFYTPREIVHYMCQESLINFLLEKMKDKCDRDDIEILIKYGELFQEKDFISMTKDKTDFSVYKDAEMPATIIDNAWEIDEALKNIKVCDPAIGSGAFPVGMLTEIVKARNLLSIFIKTEEDRCLYQLKNEAIQNSIYGVDIEPSAVDIAKLRLWLSLIVDEDDFNNIKPLPNLDYKIMQGNSLVDEFEGIKLFDSRILKKTGPAINIVELKKERSQLTSKLWPYYEKNPTWMRNKKIDRPIELFELEKKIDGLNKVIDSNSQFKPYQNTQTLFDFKENKSIKIAKELQKSINNFFNVSDKSLKQTIKNRIEHYELELITESLTENGKTSLIPKIKKSFHEGSKPYFLWEMNFSEVFQENGGFDIVIGNPPYMRIQGLLENFPHLSDYFKSRYISATGRYDLYCLFTELGADLLTKNGYLNYIMPFKWSNSSFGKGLRKYIFSNGLLNRIISFGSHQIFNASTYSSLIWLKRDSANKSFMYVSLDEDLLSNNELQNWLSKLNWNLSSNIEVNKIDGSVITLADNQSLKIINKIKDFKINVTDIFQGIFQGIVTGDNDIFWLHNCKIIDNYLEGYSKASNKNVRIEIDLIKPLLNGNSINKYDVDFSKTYIIYPYYLDSNNKTVLFEEDILKNKYPYAFDYLIGLKDRLSKRGSDRMVYPKWYALWNHRNILIQESKNKILTPDVCYGCQMWCDINGSYYYTDTSYAFVIKEEYKQYIHVYYAIFNSNILWYFLQKTGAVLRGGYFRFKTSYLKEFKLPEIKQEMCCFFEKLLKIKSYRAIDILVYKLYKLEYSEVISIDKSFKQVLNDFFINIAEYDNLDFFHLANELTK